MATAEYKAWNSDGRPLKPSGPIRESVEQMNVAYPDAAEEHLFSWYADEAHYQADNPQDHTPYSYTAWPIKPCPYPVVFATDFMHRPDLGVDCDELFEYWIAEARAGRTPWVKYYIWRRKIYDSRKNWVAAPASGHDDHIHRSDRSDTENATMGGWRIAPEGDDMTPEQSKDLHFLIYRVYGIETMADPIVIPARADLGVPKAVLEPNLLARAIKAAGGALSAEDLAEVKAAAKEGAEAGAPTHEELKAAAFEGAQQAEKE